MSRRNLRSFSFLVFAFLLASSFMGCGEQGGSPSGTTPTPPVSWRGTQQFGTPFNDVGQGIARDSSANIYITGSTGGNLDGNTSSGRLDVFVSKFDSTGNRLLPDNSERPAMISATGLRWTKGEMFMSLVRPEGLREPAFSPTFSWSSSTLPA